MGKTKLEAAILNLLENDPENHLGLVLETCREICEAVYDGSGKFTSLRVDDIISRLESDLISGIALEKGWAELMDQVVEGLRTIKDNADQETVTF